MLSPLQKAGVLTEALPYIQAFYDKIVVIKYGGGAMVDPALEELVLKDVILMKLIGMKPVLVHGGGPMINHWLERLDIRPEFIDGLRVTDEVTMEVVEMVLAGRLNKGIVSRIQGLGGRAVGLCGKDGGMIRARRVEGDRDLGLVGEILSADPGLIQTLIDQGFIPVVSSVAAGQKGESLNINADTMASALGGALRAHKLVLLTDVEGIFLGEGDGRRLASSLLAAEIPGLIASGALTGGMIPKAKGCLEAVEQGVENVHIIDGRQPHALLLEIFTKEGIGTWVKKAD
ncbi:MAG: acetylglutamate kinase [Peptococcaceae bacterium]|jgi:acetylglutamate kinase|nr:acetylglutamate kinase [Peptococcaceae bacterium]